MNRINFHSLYLWPFLIYLLIFCCLCENSSSSQVCVKLSTTPLREKWAGRRLEWNVYQEQLILSAIILVMALSHRCGRAEHGKKARMHSAELECGGVSEEGGIYTHSRGSFCCSSTHACQCVTSAWPFVFSLPSLHHLNRWLVHGSTHGKAGMLKVREIEK